MTFVTLWGGDAISPTVEGPILPFLHVTFPFLDRLSDHTVAITPQDKTSWKCLPSCIAGTGDSLNGTLRTLDWIAGLIAMGLVEEVDRLSRDLIVILDVTPGRWNAVLLFKEEGSKLSGFNASEFDSQRFDFRLQTEGESSDYKLGGRMETADRQPCNGTEVDNRARTLFTYVWQKCASDIHSSKDIGVELHHSLFGIRFFDAIHLEIASIVDENVDAAVNGNGFLGDLPNLWARCQ